jgi:hypothetical protein
MKRASRAAVALATVALAGAAFVASPTRIIGLAWGDDRATASTILNELANDAAHKDATEAIVKRGREALERATRMRAAGDEAHAQLADGLAREEAEAGRDLVRALEAERMADEARRAATDAGTVGERERALLEEGIARNGRLRAEIDELGKGGGGKGKEPRASKLSSVPIGDAGAPPRNGASGTSAGAGKSDGGAR